MSRAKRRPRRSRTDTIAWLGKPFQKLTNPLPPIEWCTPDQLDQLHNASMDILENVGVDFWDEEALSVWEKAGAKVDHRAQHVWIDRGLLLEQVEKAPTTFTWHARQSDYNLTFGGNYINFALPCGMPYVSDIRRGRRVATLEDFTNFIKMAHMIPFFHFAGGLSAEPQEVPVSLRHLYRVRAMIYHTDRAIIDPIHGRIITADIVRMMEIAMGGSLPGPALGGVINVNSPLRYDQRMLGGLITTAKLNQPCIITPFIMAGAMSPVTIAAALAQQNAEALAGVALSQLINPGAPVVYGGFTQNVDMRSGSPAFGGPEGAWAILVGAQLARRYGIPYRSSGSLTNAKVPDAQAAYETMWTMWPAILAHTHYVNHSAGWLEAGLVASYEKFIIDAENLAMFVHFLQNFTIDDETLAIDAIAEVGPGGHHFGTSHTLARYDTAFYEPVVTDRQGYETWQSTGSEDTLQRAHKLYQQVLTSYEQPPIDEAIVEELDAFVARRERELEGVDLYD